MSATETLTHQYRSYGEASGCPACVAQRVELQESELTVLDEVERVDYVRSADEIVRAITGDPTAEAHGALVSLERLADAEMIERRNVDRVVPPGPSFVGYVRLDSMFGHRASAA